MSLDSLLTELNALDGFTVFASEVDNSIYLRWESDTLEPGYIIDFAHPQSVAEAVVERHPDGGGEWVKVAVQESARNSGILTSCFDLSREALEEAGLWPAYIAHTANNPDFYREAGWQDSEQYPGLMVKNQAKTQKWVKARSKKEG